VRDGSDAKRLGDADWDSNDGHYRVRIDGEWVDVPNGSCRGWTEPRRPHDGLALLPGWSSEGTSHCQLFEGQEMTKTNCVVAMRAIRRIEAAVRIGAPVESSARSEGLTSFIDLDVLRAVADAPDGRLRIGEIEKLLGIPQYTTSRITTKLVSKGLLSRMPCEDDRRGQAVSITGHRSSPSCGDCQWKIVRALRMGRRGRASAQRTAARTDAGIKNVRVPTALPGILANTDAKKATLGCSCNSGVGAGKAWDAFRDVLSADPE
jgi:DNA-binding MarR family transcriptional regulator